MSRFVHNTQTSSRGFIWTKKLDHSNEMIPKPPDRIRTSALVSTCPILSEFSATLFANAVVRVRPCPVCLTLWAAAVCLTVAGYEDVGQASGSGDFCKGGYGTAVAAAASAQNKPASSVTGPGVGECCRQLK